MIGTILQDENTYVSFLKEADTDDKQGTLGFDEFCSFYKMMSTRRDLYLLMLTYSNLKDHLDTDDLARFLNTEQKVNYPSHIYKNKIWHFIMHFNFIMHQRCHL